MAMMSCKEKGCGKEISTDATVCPHCGKKVVKGPGCLKIMLISIGVFFGFIFFLAMVKGCVSGFENADSSPESTPTKVVNKTSTAKTATQPKKTGKKPVTPGDSQPAANTGNEQPRFARIGDEVQAGNFYYRVDEIAFKKTLGNDFASETADGVFLLIAVSLKNAGSKPQTIDNSLFKLTDEAGTEYESSTNGSTAVELSGGKTLFLKQCQPNITTSGILVFEVPDQTKTYDLLVSGGIWSGDTALIKLIKK